MQLIEMALIESQLSFGSIQLMPEEMALRSEFVFELLRTRPADLHRVHN